MQAPKLLLASFAAAIFCLPAPALSLETPTAITNADAIAAAPYIEVPAAMAALLPADLTVVLLTRPLAEIEGIALGLAEEIAPEMAGMMSVDLLLTQAGLDPAIVDKTKPIGFALGTLSMGSEPQAFLIVPTTDGDALKAAIIGMSGLPAASFQSKVVGGYMGLTMGSTYPDAGESDLLHTVPAGMMGLAIDVETIVDTFGPLIQMGMGMARMQATADLPEDMPLDIGAMMDTYFGMVESAMDSIEQARFSIDITDSLLDIRAVTVVSEGSPMASIASGKKTNIARLIPLMGEGSLSLALGADWGDMMTKSMPLMESLLGAYPDELGKGMRASMDAFKDIYNLFGTGMVASGGFGDNGMQVSAFFDGAHFDEILVAYKEALELPFWEELGMKYSGTKTGKSGDVSVTRFSFDFDMATIMEAMGEDLPPDEVTELKKMMAALYGESLVITFANSKDIGVMVIGADDTLMTDALGRVAAGGKIPEELTHLTDLVATSNPFFSCGVDVGELLSTIVPMIEGLMGAPASGMEMFEELSLPINMYFGASKSLWTTGLMVDLVQVSEFAQMMAMMGDL